MTEDPIKPAGETPRYEPEIIPPGADFPFRGRADSWSGTGGRGAYRLHVARLGPIGFGLIVLGIGLLAAFLLAVVAGALVVWMAVGALLAAGSVFAARLRQSFRRQR
jgi:hypothetical protein